MAPFVSRLGAGGGSIAGFGFGRIGYKAPTYLISPSTSSVNEGSTVTFNVVTTNVSNGTTLYWTTNTVSGTVNSSDFNDSATSGSFTITNGSGTITRTLANDATTEGSESFQLQVRTGSISGPIVATSSTVTINDTSLAPTYSVSPSTTSVNEGSSVTFTTTTTNVSDGTTLYWTVSTVSGTINASDFSGGATSGSFTVTSNSGSVVLTLANDQTTEGSESFQFQVRTGSTSGTIVATSSTVTINDTSIVPISATGGTISTPGDGFRYHAFTTVGASSFVVNSAPSGATITVLVVGGGGAGGGGWGGSGGGAGGVMYASAFPVPTGPATYPLSVGGGASNSSQNVSGTPGTQSVFNGVPAGGGRAGVGGSPGNNTGGAQGPVTPSGSFTAYGPYPGGSPPVSPGGGGGGAGAAGNPSGQGGIGVRFPAFLNYGTPGPAGSGGYFAGGGGTNPVNPGAAGGGSNSPTPAVANTGGGGGSINDGYPNTSAAGIILIRYPY